jgi:ornithine--oxo-acid transaminase
LAGIVYGLSSDREALISVLKSQLPNLVQMDVSTLARILAKRLLAHVPYLDKVFF